MRRFLILACAVFCFAMATSAGDRSANGAILTLTVNGPGEVFVDKLGAFGPGTTTFTFDDLAGVKLQAVATSTMQAVTGPYVINAGDDLVLDASGSTGNSKFLGWSGDLSGSLTAVGIKMDEPEKDVVADFTFSSQITSYTWTIGSAKFSSKTPGLTIEWDKLSHLGAGKGFVMTLAVTDTLGATATTKTTLTILPTADVPEPASLAIWSLGAFGCAMGAYRRRKRA
jgi:hypothetical protein